MQDMRFSPQGHFFGRRRLAGGPPIFVDSNMIRSGLSLARLRAVCADYGPERLICHVADEDVAEEARHPRPAPFPLCRPQGQAVLDGAIAVFGNAPIALMELNRMIMEENIRPALVVAMPVGFVHVVESKQELMSLDVPYIALGGRRGGSPLAVSVIHALCSLADRKKL